MIKKIKKRIRNFFRDSVVERDCYRCRKCGFKPKDPKNLDPHHITDRNLFENGGYIIENGISLCGACHLKAEKFHMTKGKEWEPGYHPDELYQLIGSSYDLAKTNDIRWI